MVEPKPESLQDQIAKELIEHLNIEHEMPESKTFTAAVTCPDSPGNTRLIVREQPYKFVEQKDRP